MQFILPAAEVSRMLLGAVQAYREQFQNPLIESGFERLATNAGPFTVPVKGKPYRSPADIAAGEMANALVKAIIEDSLNDRLIWFGMSGTSNQYDKVFGTYFPDHDTHESVRFYDHFTDTVVVDAVRTIDGLVHNHIPQRSWKVWYTRKLGKDLVLESGADFRVLDWTRRMESGEWSSAVSEPLPTEQELINAAVDREIARDEHKWTEAELRSQGFTTDKNAKVVRLDVETAQSLRPNRRIRRRG